MAPTGGDFAHMTGEAMLEFANSNMTKKTQGALNKELKALIPNWPSARLGVGSEEARAAWRAASSKKRKAAIKMMDVKFRDDGGLGIGEARLAVSDYKQIDSPDGGIMNVGQIDTGADLIPSNHPSYSTALRGEGLGRLPEGGRPYITELLEDQNAVWHQAGVSIPENDPLFLKRTEQGLPVDFPVEDFVKAMSQSQQGPPGMPTGPR